MAHVYLDDHDALLDPSLRLALLLQAQEAFGPATGAVHVDQDPDATLINADLNDNHDAALGSGAATHNEHEDAAHAASMQLIQDMFLADFFMTQEEEQLRRDKALAMRLREIDDRGVDDRVYAGINNPMPIVRAEDLPLYVPPPPPVMGECTVCFSSLRIVPRSRGVALPAATDAAQKDDGAPADGVLFPTCEHEYCAGCLLSWIKSTVNDRTLQFPTTCAHDGCTATLTGEHARKLLAGTAHQQLREKYLLRNIEASGRAVYCPRRACGAMVVVENVKQLQDAPDALVVCSQCQEQFCFRCRVADHYPLSCAQYRALPAHERDPEDVALHRLAEQNQWKRCPLCRAVVERKVGCNYMKCLCGAGWCFRCGTKYLDHTSTVLYQHGRPGCDCLLFDMPGEQEPPAPAPRQVRVGIVVAQALLPLQDDDHDDQPVQDPRAPAPWPRSQNGRRIMACGPHREVLHPDDPDSRLPAWLANTYRSRECHYCGHDFESWDALINHFHTTDAHGVWLCCGRTFMDVEGYLNHLDNAHDGRVQNW
ncbi:hypothetical protein AMAG_05088 [Allomyces macrogynus ATCC 38327]|uniref:RBR-type E3 ubiquitin transferase n=1 Tax=Allomyces macrogynus (strain ATCC 38327) TaxID=578462 RepID=A0A0L0S6P5_ALLM3|nr:hypothetical protein AMAG_05088 [Allomyces macrogynus ATCC 38327]|eukprot:KNE58278.1 hypothetical protein AMAG_05088 [Allomyces macrogynus ATCC 38327]